MSKKDTALSKVIRLIILCIIAVTALFSIALYKQVNYQKKAADDFDKGNQVVFYNEISKLVERGENDLAIQRLNQNINEIRESENAPNKNNIVLLVVFYFISILSILVVMVAVYMVVLRPFDKLERYANEIAKGNLEADLKYERVNVFGQFTWAFDHMRKEIIKARKCEQEAIENNKTVIATLSHDIKTPVASIRAYAEGLTENMDINPERRDRYCNVIIKKCDEVTKITNDMFIHSLHDLDKLVIKREEVEISEVINETVESLKKDSVKINLKEIKSAKLTNVDAGRIAQVIENVISNSMKYAEGSQIDVWTELLSDSYKLHIRDYGKGIPAADLPFIFEKFYRGSNKGGKDGAGLGLFIVKYIMEQMDGSVSLISTDEGLETILTFMS